MRLMWFLLIFQRVDDDDFYNDCGTRDDGNGFFRIHMLLYSCMVMRRILQVFWCKITRYVCAMLNIYDIEVQIES